MLAVWLTSNDGQCGAWAHFFVRMRQMHGIVSKDEYLFVKSNTKYKEHFLIKEWDFQGSGRSGYTDYPYLNIEDIPFKKSTQYCWKYADVTDRKIASPPRVLEARGQGVDDPASRFTNHELVRIDGEIYDPSYGLKYDSILDFDNNAITGFSRRVMLQLDETSFGVTGIDLNRDNKIEERAKVYSRVIRKNEINLDMRIVYVIPLSP